jgi:PKD repeat protein
MKARLVFLCLLIPLITLMMTLAIEPVSSVDTRVFVTPPVSYAQQGESFNVTVRVEDATSAHAVFSFYINMSFNPDILQYDNVTEGEFLEDQPDGTIAWGPRVEQERGWIFFGWATKGQHSGVDGDGSLAIVRFNVTDMGESWLNITNPQTVLIEMQPFGGGFQPVEISCTLENGEFTNIAGVPPEASFTYSPEKPYINGEVTFNASDSYDPDETGYIVSYKWDFGDGTTEVYIEDVNLTAIAKHTYTTGGSKSVKLTVKDNVGMENDVTADVRVRFEHDIAIKTVDVSKTEVSAGESVTVSVTVVNQGASTETFTVTAYYDTTSIGEETVSNLSVDDEETVDFVWETSGVTEGKYAIKAIVTGVDDDGDATNNQKFGGSVDVKPAAGFPIAYAIAAAVVVIVVILGIFLYLRRKG